MNKKMILFDEYSPPGNEYNIEEKAKEWNSLDNRQNPQNDLRMLDLSSDDVLLDIGCGAGFHLIEASKTCSYVYGLDISKEMLKICNHIISKRKIKNVTTYNKGFLSIPELKTKPTKVFSWGALHHLPDFWKYVALQNIANTLPNGGQFYLLDMIYSFNPPDYNYYQKLFIEEVHSEQGNKVASDVVCAFSEEYVTFDFILEKFIELSGFEIISKKTLNSKCWSNYLLEKCIFNNGKN